MTPDPPEWIIDSRSIDELLDEAGATPVPGAPMAEEDAGGMPESVDLPEGEGAAADTIPPP